MANIQPFNAIRYDVARVGNLSEVIAPPYDVISANLQNKLYDRHPNNFVRLILNRPEPGDEADSIYRRAAGLFQDWQRNGILEQDHQAGIYVYHQEFTVGDQTFDRRGFSCRVRLEPYESGSIYPHEQTHSSAKEDRLKLTKACQANMSQIFGIYSDPDNEVQESLESSLADPTPVQATDDLGIVHRMWRVTDTQAIAAATGLMGQRAIYIADGHHRYETALNYQQYLAGDGLPDNHPANYVLMNLVSMHDPGMIVLPTHRLIRGVDPIDSKALAGKLGNHFDCQSTDMPIESASSVWDIVADDNDQGVFGVYTRADDRWTIARIQEAGQQKLAEIAADRSDAWRDLGVSILHRLILESLLYGEGLPAPKYVRETDELIESIRQGDSTERDLTGQVGTGRPFELAFIVKPATLEHVQQLSKFGERMPAKSTYFYPKLASGLVVNPLR